MRGLEVETVPACNELDAMSMETNVKTSKVFKRQNI
jgi:hypothetical protein